MKKILRIISIFFIMVLAPACMCACNDSRPDFYDDTNVSDSSFDSHHKLTFPSSIAKIISEDLMIIDDETFIADNGKIKINITLPEIYSSDGERFYYNSSNDSLISGVFVNNSFHKLSYLENEIKITKDTEIMFESTKLNLHFCSLLLCQNLGEANEKIFENFNTNSAYFSKMILESDEYFCLNIPSDAIGLSFTTLFDFNLNKTDLTNENFSNIECDSKNFENSQSLDISTFYETTEISVRMVYFDVAGNIYFSSPQHFNKFSTNKDEVNYCDASLLCDFESIKLNFAKYYLKLI